MEQQPEIKPKNKYTPKYKEKRQALYQANKEKIKEINNKRYEEKRESIREYQKNRYNKIKEKLKLLENLQKNI